MKHKLYTFLPALGWLILCTVLLTLPQSSFPRQSWLFRIPGFDKWVHIGLFGMLALLTCYAIYKRKPFTGKMKHQFIAAGLSCLLYGIIMEFVQKYWVPLRSFDAGDIAADAAGAAAGVFFSIRMYLKK